MREVSGEFFVFQQDNAPAHRHATLCDFSINAGVPPELWPANSPDLNLVDYRIWSVVQQRVYQSRVHDIDELKQRLQQVWRDVDQSITDNAIDEWRKRLHACVQAKGGHFEHLLIAVENNTPVSIQPYDNINVSFLSNTRRILIFFFCCDLQ